MKNRTLQSLIFVLILSSLFSVNASGQDKNITPILSILLAGPKLPPGTTIFPETGATIVRYDRTNSTDWIEIVGIEISDKPSFPITRVQGNVYSNSFTIIWIDEKPVKFIYPIWTIDITYDPNDKPNWTFVETATASPKAAYSLEKASAVDCTKPRQSYEIALIEAEVLWARFYAFWTDWTIQLTDKYISGAVGELERMSESLGVVFSRWEGNPEDLMPFIENKIEATELLANYDKLCSPGVTTNIMLHRDVTFHGNLFLDAREQAPLETLIDGVFVPNRRTWDLGTVSWTVPTAYITFDLGGVFDIISFIAQVDDNDAYILSYWDIDSKSWQLAWDIPNYDSIGHGMTTRPNPEDNTEAYSIGLSIRTNALKLQSGTGAGYYSVSEVQAFGVEVSGE